MSNERKVGRPDPTPIVFSDFAKLIRATGWVVWQTDEHQTFLKGRSASLVDIRTDGVLVLILGVGGNGSSHRYELNNEYWITYGAYPYLLQVWHRTLQSCSRAESEGGGMHEKLLPKVFLTFYNESLRPASIRPKREPGTPRPRKEPRPAPPAREWPDLVIVDGPNREEIQAALSSLAAPRGTAISKLRFTTKDGNTREGGLIGCRGNPFGTGGSLSLEVEGFEDGLVYDPETKRGAIYDDGP